jgi:hypothetical protein
MTTTELRRAGAGRAPARFDRDATSKPSARSWAGVLQTLESGILSEADLEGVYRGNAMRVFNLSGAA